MAKCKQCGYEGPVAQVIEAAGAFVGKTAGVAAAAKVGLAIGSIGGPIGALAGTAIGGAIGYVGTKIFGGAGKEAGKFVGKVVTAGQDGCKCPKCGGTMVAF